MIAIPQEVLRFLEKQGFVIISTLDENQRIHCAAKGIVGLEKEGRVHIIDVYRGRTFSNLKKNPTASVTAVDERQFHGYTLKGVAGIVEREKIAGHIIQAWEDRVIRRISGRLIHNVKNEKKTGHHPESRLPQPQYLITLDVEEIVDLAPAHLKAKG